MVSDDKKYKIAQAKELIAAIENSSKAIKAEDRKTKVPQPAAGACESGDSDDSEKAGEYTKARIFAVKYIGLDPGKSSGKVHAKLREFGYSPSLARKVVEDLEEADYIDDYRACAKIARRHQGSKSKSRQYMKNLFIKQGVKETVAELYMDYLPDDRESIQNLLPQTLPEGERDINKLMRRLQARGYAFNTIQSCIRMLEKNS